MKTIKENKYIRFSVKLILAVAFFLITAAAMLNDPTITKTEVAKHFEVSRPTLNAALKRFGYPQNPANKIED